MLDEESSSSTSTRERNVFLVFLLSNLIALPRQESHNGGKNSTLHFIPNTAKQSENTWFCLCFDISCVKLAAFWCLDWLAFIKFAHFHVTNVSPFARRYSSEQFLTSVLSKKLFIWEIRSEMKSYQRFFKRRNLIFERISVKSSHTFWKTATCYPNKHRAKKKNVHLWKYDE